MAGLGGSFDSGMGGSNGRNAQPYENFQVGPVCRVDFANRQKFLLKTVFPEHPLIFQPLAYLQRVQTSAAAVVGVEEGFFCGAGAGSDLG